MTLRINLTTLREGVTQEAFAPSAQELALDPDQFSDIRVAAVLDAHNGRILVSLKASALAVLECDRTLVPFTQPLEGAFRCLYVPASFLDEDVQVLHPSDREIDLTEMVRDTLLLAIPIRKIAPGAEEADIKTVFGAPEDNGQTIDPRWEALRALRPENGSTES